MQATLSHIFSDEVGAKKCLWTNMRQVSQLVMAFQNMCTFIGVKSGWKLNKIMWNFANFPRTRVKKCRWRLIKIDIFSTKTIKIVDYGSDDTILCGNCNFEELGCHQCLICHQLWYFDRPRVYWHQRSRLSSLTGNLSLRVWQISKLGLCVPNTPSYWSCKDF